MTGSAVVTTRLSSVAMNSASDVMTTAHAALRWPARGRVGRLGRGRLVTGYYLRAGHECLLSDAGGQRAAVRALARWAAKKLLGVGLAGPDPGLVEGGGVDGGHDVEEHPLGEEGPQVLVGEAR